MSFIQRWTQWASNAINWLVRSNVDLRNDVNALKEWKTKVMAEIDDLKTAVKAAEDRLDSFVAVVNPLKETIQKLQDEIANNPNSGDAIKAIASDLADHVTAFDAAMAPPAPVDGGTSP